MNHFVPDFDADDDYFIPGSSSSSSSLNLTNKSAMAEDDIVELLWHNGQVVMQSQTQQRPNTKKSSSPAKLGGGVGGGHASELEHTPPSPPHQQPSDQNHVFIQEDEMASWLHYPLHDEDFCSDLLYSGAAHTSASQPPQSVSQAPPEKSANQVTATKPPPAPPQRKTENEQRTVRNFVHFSRLRGSNTSVVESGHSIPKAVSRHSPVVDSSITQSAVGSDAIKRTAGLSAGIDTRGVVNGGGSGSSASRGGASSSAAPCARGKEVAAAREASATSSTRVSTGREEPVNIPPTKATPSPADDRKRKGKETDEVECHSEDNKQGGGLTSTKRSRAAEVHNLSERRRRDRINEKMRALQELIPRCNKSDKASMLDEAIEYLKSLQLQVQMMSMGCGMVPMMYPGMQHYMPQMAMGMGMEMGMNRPLMPFPFPNTLTPPHMGGPRFAGPPFPVPNVQASDPFRVHVTNHPDAMLHLQRPNQPQVPGFLDPCLQQQILGLHPMQASMVQSQATAEPSSSKPSNTSEEPEDQESHPAPAG